MIKCRSGCYRTTQLSGTGRGDDLPGAERGAARVLAETLEPVTGGGEAVPGGAVLLLRLSLFFSFGHAVADAGFGEDVGGVAGVVAEFVS